MTKPTSEVAEPPRWAFEAADKGLKAVKAAQCEPWRSDLARIIWEACQQQLERAEGTETILADSIAELRRLHAEQIGKLKAEHQQQIAAAEEATIRMVAETIATDFENREPSSGAWLGRLRSIAVLLAKLARLQGNALARHDAELRERWEKEQK